MDDSSTHDIWRSYSDMMSGLLLLFVLIMAVCLMQAQKNYTEKLAEQARQIQTQSELEASQLQVDEQQVKLNEQTATLSLQAAALERLQATLEAQKLTLGEKESEIAASQAQVQAQNVLLAQQESELTAQSTSLQTKESELALSQSQLTAQQALLAQQESELAQQESELNLNKSQLALQGAALASKESELTASQQMLDSANAVMAQQKTRIDQIIGVKAELIEALNEEFDSNQISVTIDKETGAILLDSSVLFDYNEFQLTMAGQRILDQILPVYCSVLLSDEYFGYVAEIIIDGYTDSTGSYITNLELSQNRAYAVAQHMYMSMSRVLTPDKFDMLTAKLTANGKSSSNPILDAYGNEDMARSRRVEIKFRLRDEEMLSELQSIIEGGNSQSPQSAAGMGLGVGIGETQPGY